MTKPALAQKRPFHRNKVKVEGQEKGKDHMEEKQINVPAPFGKRHAITLCCARSGKEIRGGQYRASKREV